jgi:hypothetical protein
MPEEQWAPAGQHTSLQATPLGHATQARFWQTSRWGSQQVNDPFAATHLSEAPLTVSRAQIPDEQWAPAGQHTLPHAGALFGHVNDVKDSSVPVRSCRLGELVWVIVIVRQFGALFVGAGETSCQVLALLSQ